MATVDALSPDGAGQAQLGAIIRQTRKSRGLTLVELAERAELSHSFLSQLERGLARPSMASLHRIAQALGTTQPALMSAPGQLRTRGAISLVRAGTGIPVDNPGGTASSLVDGSHGLYPILFVGASTGWGEWYTHAGEELIHVISGSIMVEVEGEEIVELNPGDTLCYPGGLAHRWRGVAGYGAETARLLFVQEAHGH